MTTEIATVSILSPNCGNERMSKTHKVTTKDFPENIQNGIMICGINYGYSIADEARDSNLGMSPSTVEPLSFFSDAQLNKSSYKTRILAWLEGWGIGLERDVAMAGRLERSYLQTNWIDSQTRRIDSDANEIINNAALVCQAQDGFLQLIEERRPRVIVFVGRMLIEAFNDIELRPRVVALLGERSGNAVAHYGDQALSKRRFTVLTQKFGDTWLVGLPHTSSQGISNEYMRSIRLPEEVLAELSKSTAIVDSVAADKLIAEMAEVMRVQDPEQLVSRIQREFHLGYSRATRIISMME